MRYMFIRESKPSQPAASDVPDGYGKQAGYCDQCPHTCADPVIRSHEEDRD
jgi:hypothetical protein